MKRDSGVLLHTDNLLDRNLKVQEKFFPPNTLVFPMKVIPNIVDTAPKNSFLNISGVVEYYLDNLTGITIDVITSWGFNILNIPVNIGIFDNSFTATLITPLRPNKYTVTFKAKDDKGFFSADVISFLTITN